MAKKRKLVPEPLLKKATELLDIGVPMSKVIRDQDLDISAPALATLVKYYKQDAAPIYLSLFPEWLDSLVITEQPDNAVYNGYFPLGQGLERK